MAFLNAVVDVSHHNANVNFAAAASDGIVAVIHKATQGQSGVDPAYKANKAKAGKAGVLWGAYHFATGGDGVRQATHLLETVDDPDVLLVLDFEANPTGPSMDVTEAHAFVEHVFQATGRYPGLYGGHYLKELTKSYVDETLAKCWFWLAQYGPTPVLPRTWKTWTMWQYTDGGFGPDPKSVKGIGRCDRDYFNGDETGLRKLWAAPTV